MGYERWDDLKSLEVGSGCCIQDYAFFIWYNSINIS